MYHYVYVDLRSRGDIIPPMNTSREKECRRDLASPHPDSMTSSRSGQRSALILYGTETGNAQEVAEELGGVTERLYFQTQVAELNRVSPVRSLP